MIENRLPGEGLPEEEERLIDPEIVAAANAIQDEGLTIAEKEESGASRDVIEAKRSRLRGILPQRILLPDGDARKEWIELNLADERTIDYLGHDEIERLVGEAQELRL